MTHELDNHTSLRAANIARQKAWDTNDAITLSYRGNELAGEVGEACNVIKKLERERLGIRGSRDTVEHLAEELADVVICADLIAMSEGIDLNAAVAAKFNATSEKVGLPQRLSVAVRALIEDRIAWHKCSCPEPCDDYNVFPGGCAGRYQKDYRTLLAALASEPANG